MGIGSSNLQLAPKWQLIVEGNFVVNNLVAELLVIDRNIVMNNMVQRNGTIGLRWANDGLAVELYGGKRLLCWTQRNC